MGVRPAESETSRKWDQQELACSVSLRPAETFIILTKDDWSMCKARHCVHDYRSEILGYSQPECGEYGIIHVIGVMCFNGVHDVMFAHRLHSLIIVPTPMCNENCSFMVQHYIPSNTIVDPMLVWCWASVIDGWPILKQRETAVLFFL